jgi:heme/copper-type cytochrome/quinol oxidase subunit 3
MKGVDEMAEREMLPHDSHLQASYGETEEVIHRRQRMGVLLFLGADVVFVAAALFTYFYLRGLNTENGWLPNGVKTVGAVDTWTVAGLIIVSALLFQVARRAGDAGNASVLRAALGVALLLVVADLVVQVMQMSGASFNTTSGAYASSYFLMASYHLFHLAILTFLGLGLFIRTIKGMYAEPERRNELDLMGLVWTWTAISAALFAFALLFTGAPHL